MHDFFRPTGIYECFDSGFVLFVSYIGIYECFGPGFVSFVSYIFFISFPFQKYILIFSLILSLFYLIFLSYKDFINIILHRQSLRGIIISHCAQLIAFLLLCNLWTPCTLSIVLCISFRITFMKQLIYYVRYFLALFFIYFSFITHFSRSISLSSTSTLTFFIKNLYKSSRVQVL